MEGILFICIIKPVIKLCKALILLLLLLGVGHMIASDLLLVILVLHDMEGLIHVAQMIIPLEGVIQGT